MTALNMSDEMKPESLWSRLIAGLRRSGGLGVSNRSFVAATVLSLVWLGGVIAYAARFFGLF